GERKRPGGARPGAARRQPRPRAAGKRRGLARARARGRAAPPPARRAEGAARPGAQRGVLRMHRSARGALVRAAPRSAARRAHRHGDGARSRQPRRFFRDHPRRPAALLAPAEGAGEIRMKIVERPYLEADRRALLEAGMHPVLARIYAGRRIRTSAELNYEASGATACAVGLRALRAFGAQVDYLVPDRFKLGYGLSPELAELAAQKK